MSKGSTLRALKAHLRSALPQLPNWLSSDCHTQKHQEQMMSHHMSLSSLMPQNKSPPMSPSQSKKLTGDIEVRGVEVLSWGQRYISTVLHFPVLAVAAVDRSGEKDEKRKG